jgi:hypothetical protein
MAGSSRLKPGEKGRIAVKVNTAGRKGSIVESVEVTSNDSLRPQVTLTIKAFVTEAGEAIKSPPEMKQPN